MSNKYIDSTLLDKAIIFAVKAHANTERRGKGFPYIVHPMEAVEIVATMTNDQEMLAAAALHDVVEDTDVSIEEITAEFGTRVARLVDLESDNGTQGLPAGSPWRDRKQAAIDRLFRASRDAKIVAMGDKLSNMRAIARDYRQLGDKLWLRFHAPNGRSDHEWHYRGLADSLSELAGTDAYTEFVYHLNAVFGFPKPELIDLNDYEVSGDGYTAISYNHKQGHRMMKLYSENIPQEVPARELAMSWHVSDMGIKIPVAYRLVTDGKRMGVEFERISPKVSFARAISQNPKTLPTYASRFAHLCRTLHTTPCNTDVFGSAADHFKQVVAASHDFNDLEKRQITDFIDSVPRTETCLHGDMHIGNMITNGEADYWIDLGDFRYGNPLFDLGMFNLACNCNPDWLTEKLFHVDNATMGEVWRIFVRDYFGSTDLQEIDRQVAPFSALYMIFFGNREGLQPYMRNYIDTHLLSSKV